MSNNDYKNYRYEEYGSSRSYGHRRGQETSSYGTGSRQRSADSGRAQESMPDFLYDARGSRVKKPRVSNEFLHTLLFFVLPYLVINGIIFALVTATPKITITIDKTNDYQSVDARVKIHSLLPLKETTLKLDSDDLSFVRDGSIYTAQITRNGSFSVDATSVNGMRDFKFCDISVLDDAPPTIDESSCHIEEGVLTFSVSDTQSGVNWSLLYASTPDGNTRIVPRKINKTTGTVSIPMDVDTLELHVTDMVGNERTATVTATTEQLTVNGPVVQ